jgi:pyruvate kinase
METTSKAPRVPVRQFKRTKIIATLGPATNTYEAVRDLIEAGANGIRLNFSHGTHEERTTQIKWIRRASVELGKPVAVVQDLQGPKIRLGDFDGMINVQEGQELRLGYNGVYEPGGIIPIQYDLAKKLKRGERLYIYDGKIRTTVTSIQGGIVYVKAENDGILLKRKGINLPDTDFGGDIITKKDLADIAYGVEHDIDYVAMSFIQHPDDIERLRRILKNHGSDAKVIAKVETAAAVEHIEGIVQTSDVIMVARGDLAIETLPESVPMVQRQIITLGRKYAKPTIVATQMMASMTESPEPTRAEVSDVATAVILGADTVMLSDETANGKYPIEAVKIMKRIILYTQQNSPVQLTFTKQYEQSTAVQESIANAAITLAEQLSATALVIESKSGATARLVSAKRPELPIIVVTSSSRVAQQMALVYGSKSYVRRDEKMQAAKLTDWLRVNKVLNKGDIIVSASGKYPGVIGTTDTIKVRVLE